MNSRLPIILIILVIAMLLIALIDAYGQSLAYKDTYKTEMQVSIKQVKNPQSWWDRPAHVGGLMLTMAYGGYVDVLVHSSRNKKDPNYKHVNGLPYLAGFGMTLLGNVYTSYNLGKKNYSGWRFALDTVAGIILGSIAWDYIYLKTQYGDGGKPVARWYTMNLGGKEHVWGFGSHKEFFMFNVARLLVGIILLMIPV